MAKTLQSSHKKGLYFLSVECLSCNNLLCGSDCAAKSVIVYNLERRVESILIWEIKKIKIESMKLFFALTAFRFTLLSKTTVAGV